jgi:hypothetical protein
MAKKYGYRLALPHLLVSCVPNQYILDFPLPLCFQDEHVTCNQADQKIRPVFFAPPRDRHKTPQIQGGRF